MQPQQPIYNEKPLNNYDNQIPFKLTSSTI